MTTRLNIISIGCDTQLLIDDYAVDDIWMIRRSPEMPVKHLENPILTSDSPFEDIIGQSVMYDEDEKIFKMWYTLHDRDKRWLPKGHTYMYRGAYAVSEDGLLWEKPKLGIIEHKGSKDNNLFLEDGTGFILKNQYEKDPERLYKMLIKRSYSKQGRVFVSFSGDGIHWADYPSGESVLPHSRDGGNPVVFDPQIGKYVLFCRPTILAAEKTLEPGDIGFPDDRVFRQEGSKSNDYLEGPPQGVGFPSENDFVMNWEAEDYIHRYLKVFPYTDTRALRIFKGQYGCNRRIARAESNDFIHWSEPDVVIRPDELDPPKFYNLNVTLYKGLYIGLLEVFYAWGNRRFPGCPQESEVFDLQLAFSRDGTRWERLANRPVFIPRGCTGAFDGGMIESLQQPLIEYGDELRIYYTGYQCCHNIPGGTMGIGIARLPKERLVARCAGDEMGVLMTKPFTVEGDRLEINADASRGLIKVEITEADGQLIGGFDVNEAIEIKNNGFSIPVEWRNGNKPADLKGKLVRLRFYMYRARLYSFRFA